MSNNSLTTEPSDDKTNESITAQNSNTTSVTTDRPTSDWHTAILVLEVSMYIIIAMVTWALLSTIVYGTKTKRWVTNAGSSSLNSGGLFVACVASIAMTLVKLIVASLIFQIPRIGRDSLGNGFTCTNVAYASALTYCASLYSVYLFLWVLQRRIYTHPSVKDRVSATMDRFSKAFVFIFSIGFFVIPTVFIIYGDKVYSQAEDAEYCVVVDAEVEAKIVAVYAVTTILIQTSMLGLCIYPAFRARFPEISEMQDAQSGSSDEESQITDSKNSFQRFYNNIVNSRAAVSPIQSHVKRLVISAVVILFTDILASGIDVIIPTEAPLLIQWFPYDLSAAINVFCMLVTFSFASDALTLFCPTCRIRYDDGRRKREKATTFSLEETEITHAYSARSQNGVKKWRFLK